MFKNGTSPISKAELRDWRIPRRWVKRKVKNKLEGYDYGISLAASDREFAGATSKMLGKPVPKFYVRRRKGRKPLFEVTFSSKVLFDLLSQPRKKLLRLVKAYPIPFLRGLFDADGYVARGIYPRIGLANKDELLRDLDVDGRMESDASSEVWKVVISKRDSIRRFAELIGFTIRRKQLALRLIAGAGFEPATFGL